MRRGRGDQRSPGGFVTPPSIKSGSLQEGSRSSERPGVRPSGSPAAKHPDPTPVRLSARREVGPGGGARGTSRPGPHPHARPRGLPLRKVAENQLRAKDGRAEERCKHTSVAVGGCIPEQETRTGASHALPRRERRHVLPANRPGRLRLLVEDVSSPPRVRGHRVPSARKILCSCCVSSGLTGSI
jgi:hypothetical protein